MTVLAIVERNKYLNQTSYLTFADVQKCFDKLWLEDGVKDAQHFLYDIPHWK